MPVNTHSSSSPKEAPDPDAPLWGAEAMAPVINRTKRQVHHLLETGQLDATKTAKIWVSTPRRLLKSVGVDVPPGQAG
jgi:hypothetical protein